MNDEGQRPEGLGGQSKARYERDEQTRLRSLGALSHMLPVLSFIYAAAAVLFLVSPPFMPNTPLGMVSRAYSTSSWVPSSII